MLRTEEEAKKTHCPLARVVPGGEAENGSANTVAGVASFNRVVFPNQNGMFLPTSAACISSRCMAWRIFEQRLHRPHSAEHEVKRLGDGWEVDKLDGSYIVNRTKGYCGAFGRP